MNKQQKRTRKRIRRLAVSAILAAMGVVLLYLGALIEVLDLSVAVLASLVCVFAVIEMGGAWPWMIYFVVSILSLVLLPQKTAAAVFALFFGYYPILKAYFERLKPIFSWVLKFLIFNVILTCGYFTVKALFGFPDAVWLETAWGGAALYVLGNATFLLYDFALTRLISAYLRKLRDRLRIRNI